MGTFIPSVIMVVRSSRGCLQSSFCLLLIVAILVTIGLNIHVIETSGNYIEPLDTFLPVKISTTNAPPSNASNTSRTYVLNNPDNHNDNTTLNGTSELYARGDREPLLEVLRWAGVNLSAIDVNSLPTWKEVADRFGDEPVVLGQDTCQAFRESIPPRQRVLGVAGPFNSGTNILALTLINNCRNVGVRAQVNWGKHQSPRFRYVNYVHEKMNNTDYLPIVAVRDPYSWFQSMCRKSYAAGWYHVSGPEGHCPNFIPNQVERDWFNKTQQSVSSYFKDDARLIVGVVNKANFTLDKPNIPVEIKYKNEIAYHESLVHFWKDWYQEYFDADFPRLMIRLEDLVFRPYEVVEATCKCAGGRVVHRSKFSLYAESIKKGSKGHDGAAETTLADAFTLHLRTNRSSGMTAEDHAFARKVLDTSVMGVFRYRHPN
eukprot:Nitzschia sp. Nitz4//scaffold66_size103028//96921//98281//NITZ4_004517-RA/size103028-snap-gene-0.148-mRNA-1//-1//CDS//3329556407//262//frame0